MVKNEYPNGYFCTYKAILCMSGFRDGCQMCLKGTTSRKNAEPQDWTKRVWESRTTADTSIVSRFAGVFKARPSSLLSKQQEQFIKNGWYLMTTLVNERTDYRTDETNLKATANRFFKRRVWISCPRCIGGNMYRDTNGEYVCIQCGCSLNPNKVFNNSLHQPVTNEL